MSTVEVTHEQWNRVLDDITKLKSRCYKDGESITLNESSPFAAYVTESTSVIRISIVVGRSLENITAVTVTQMKGAIISVNGYLNAPSASAAGSHQTNWGAMADVTITPHIINEHLIELSLSGTGAFYNATNNRPAVYAPAYGGLILTFEV